MRDKIILELTDCLIDIAALIKYPSDSPHLKQLILNSMEYCYDEVKKILDEKC